MNKQQQILMNYMVAISVLLLPLILFQSGLLGADSLFHYNRFYDVGMQLKEHNLQYVISMYGFQESGRIVNALYGPLSAYFLGGLVLVSGTWFRYQVLSNLILYLLSFFSMNGLLKSHGVHYRNRYVLSFFYVTTFSIQYWTLRQGFSSWGAALMPLCLIPLTTLLKHHKIPSLYLGMSIAVMTQTHLFSSLVLVIIYLVAFIYVWVTCHRKGKLLRELVVSVLLFLVLTMNVWVGMAHVFLGNQLLPPFINQTMFLNTVTSGSVYWLYVPVLMLPMMIWQGWMILKHYQVLSLVTRFIGGLSLLFLVLSTNLVPWGYLSTKKVWLVELIQFPFRFFIPFTVLFCLLVGLTITEAGLNVAPLRLPMALIVLFSTVVSTSFHVHYYHTAPLEERLGKHVRLAGGNQNDVIASLHSKNLSDLLTLLTKSTPDYVPLYEETEANKYELYRSEIIEVEGFQKRVVDESLVIEWEAEQEGDFVPIPIVVYKGSRLRFNGVLLDNEQLELSAIGRPTLMSQKGQNQLVLTYSQTSTLNRLFISVCLIWVACFIYLGYQKKWYKEKFKK